MAGYIGSKSSVVLNAGATAVQGALADTAVQPNDNVTLGAVTATSFSGDGSGLTGLSAGAVEVVSAGDAINVSSVEFTNLDTDNYNYEVVLENFICITGDSGFGAQMSVNNGSSYITTNYRGTYYYGSSTASTSNHTYDTNNSWALFTDDVIGGAAGEYGYSGTIKLFQNNSMQPAIIADGNYWDTAGVFYECKSNVCNYSTTSKVNALKIYYLNGNIETGRYVLYRKARA